jgi:hypothetical protein
MGELQVVGGEWAATLAWRSLPGTENGGHITHALKVNRTNPWRKPGYFERIIRRNIAQAAGPGDIMVHDVEFSFEENTDKAWEDAEARAASGAMTKAEFAKAYQREWATWLWLPCHWTKQDRPGLPVGLYGPQPFRRDYWGVAGKSARQIDGTHHSDAELWQYIDPHVDFYIASVYVFYDDPGSIYYIAANVEENYQRTRRYGNKPIYAYEWLRYHNSNQKLVDQELAPYLVEALAVLPYFCGAKGVVLWGWEPKRKGQYYQNLPVFADSLGRVSDLSAKLAKAELVIDEPAHDHFDRGHVNFILRGKPVLIEAGTPSYDNPRLHELYSSVVGHNVLEISGCTVKKMPAPITALRLDSAGGEVVVDPTAGYSALKRWLRRVRWDTDRLDVVDEVVFPADKSGVLTFRWHLGTQDQVGVDESGAKVTVTWPDAKMTLESAVPLAVTWEMLPDNTVTLGKKVGPDYLHRCIVVRTAQPCNAWTLKTSVAAK